MSMHLLRDLRTTCAVGARRARLLPAMGALVLMTGCGLPGFLRVSAPKDGTTVKKLSTKLAFGTEPQAAHAGVRTAPVLPTLGPIDLTGPQFDTAPFTDFPEFGGFQFPNPCPEAGPGKFPEKSATFAVQGQPVPGVYKWKQKGTLTIPPLPAIALNFLGNRQVTMVPTVTPGAFAFDIERLADFGIEVDTYEVRQNNPSTPTDGIYLTRLRYENQKGAVLMDFNPPSLLAPKLVSLPVVDETTTPVPSVDPTHQLVLTVSGTVDGHTRQRLDACGELVEAWKFSGVRVLQGVTDQSQAIRDSTYEFWFAPQLGGLIVGDHIVSNGTLGVIQYSTDMTTNIGELKPTGKVK
jgi:hypothetical protein